MERTFLALLQFDGTRFLGWQRQASGRTVQAVVEQVLERLSGHPVRVHGAGRTDAGVHAVGMGISFRVGAQWNGAPLRMALNALLPDDCWVAALRPARDGFHARKSAMGRRYRYEVGTDEAAASPFRRGREWSLGRPLDLDLLRRAAEPLLGRHDFGAFAVGSAAREHSRCEVRLAAWEPRPEGMGATFHVAADRFVHHMVRMLVATTVDVALGRRPVGDIPLLLHGDPALRSSPPAPPGGLYFVAAEYPEHWFEPEEPTA